MTCHRRSRKHGAVTVPKTHVGWAEPLKRRSNKRKIDQTVFWRINVCLIPMATQTTASESPTMTKPIEERLEEYRLEEPAQQAEVENPVETYALPETEEKETLKEEVTPQLTENETPLEQIIPKVVEKETITEQEIPDETPEEIGTSKEQEIPKTTEQESLPMEGIPEVAEQRSLEKLEALEATDKETPKEQETPKDNAPAEVADENVKRVVEEERPAKEVSESVDKKEQKNAEVRGVAVPAVDQTSEAERQNKTEEVPTTVVHEVQSGAKPSQSRPSNIFHNVGSKMMQSVQKMKNAIIGKSSK